MSISNKFGAMVVTTGNKSEMSVGYATLYGDMNGGFNPIKDLYKMEVFRLADLRNRWKPAGALGPDGEVIPPDIIVKPPTAELRENQKDEDSLPPYRDARRDPAAAWSRRRCASPTSSPRASIPRPCAESSGCSISPNTSAASRRRASRSARRISAATAAIRSSTASAIPARPCSRPTPRSRRARREGTSERFEE